MRVGKSFLSSLVCAALAMSACSDDPTFKPNYEACSGHSRNYCRLTHPITGAWNLDAWQVYAGQNNPEKSMEPDEFSKLLIGPNLPQDASPVSLVFEMDSSWTLTFGQGESAMRRGMFIYDEEEETIEGVDLLWDPDGNADSFENVKLDGGGDAGSQLSFEIHASQDLYFNLRSCCWE